jgi:hypothetical protein
MTKNHHPKTLMILKYLKGIEEIIMTLTTNKNAVMMKMNSIGNSLEVSLIFRNSLKIFNCKLKAKALIMMHFKSLKIKSKVLVSHRKDFKLL